MSNRRSFLLSPYRLPTHQQVLLNEDEMAAWLNGAVCLWHPALVSGRQGAPQVDSSYDHDLPGAGEVFAVPAAPPLFQPDDWSFRVLHAGAIRFEAAPSREQTLANLKQAIEAAAGGDVEEGRQAFGAPEIKTLLDLPLEKVQPFFGLSFGYLMIESLFDAMDHEHLLQVEEFWGDVRQAAAALLQPGAGEEVERHLRQAAARLLSAREVLYPIAVHVLDIAWLDPNRPDAPLPAAFERGLPLNLLATGQTLEKLAAVDPERISAMKEKLNPEIQPPVLEICGGVYREREDALLPIESQLWNFDKGRSSVKNLLGVELQVYGRKRSAFHPQTPQYLRATGLQHALLLNLDNAVIPSHHASVVNWSSPDGKSIDAFTRMPLKARLAQTFFNLVHSLHQAISQDSAPTIALLHEDGADSPLYDDWLALSKLAPVLGQWTTFHRYFSDALAGEYAGAANPDDFFSDYLEERINERRPDPVSAFARQARQRRRIDSAWALAAIQRTLVAPTDADNAALGRLREIEDLLETQGLDGHPGGSSQADVELAKIEAECAEKLAARLQQRAADDRPGYLLVNPCAFARRAALELDPIDVPFPIEAPVKAAQFDADKLRVVVEVPALGFAWLPRSGKPGTPPPKPRLRLAQENIVRNEYFEAEIDPATGGLRAVRDLKTRRPRLAQQLVYNPGSKMEGRSMKVILDGAAVGEIATEGVILDEHNQTLATFRQHFRAWLGRPMLNVRIEIEPVAAPSGYPWHAYYGARFGWRDDSAALMRGANGVSNQTNHARPVSPDFLEIRTGQQNALIFPGGLPFHQRHGTRMVDVILVPEGETCRVFHLGIALDRENFLQNALGFVSPVAVVPTAKGPPHIGPSGWLFHVDVPNLVMIQLKPAAAADGARRLLATFVETTGYSGSAQFRCVRNPSSAYVLDGEGTPSTELPISGDAIRIDFSANDLLRVQIEFG